MKKMISLIFITAVSSVWSNPYPLEEAYFFHDPEGPRAFNIIQFEGKAADILYQQLEVPEKLSNTGVCEEFRGKKCSKVKVGKNYSCIISPKECSPQKIEMTVCAYQLLGDTGESLPLECAACSAH